MNNSDIVRQTIMNPANWLRTNDEHFWEVLQSTAGYRSTAQETGYLCEIYEYRTCNVTGQDQPSYNCFLQTSNEEKKRHFMAKEGLTQAEFDIIRAKDVDDLDKQIPENQTVDSVFND